MDSADVTGGHRVVPGSGIPAAQASPQVSRLVRGSEPGVPTLVAAAHDGCEQVKAVSRAPLGPGPPAVARRAGVLEGAPLALHDAEAGRALGAVPARCRTAAASA